MLGFWSVRLRADPWRFLALRKRMRSGDRPGLQNRRVAGNPVTGGFDPHSLPPFVFNWLGLCRSNLAQEFKPSLVKVAFWRLVLPAYRVGNSATVAVNIGQPDGDFQAVDRPIGFQGLE